MPTITPTKLTYHVLLLNLHDFMQGLQGPSEFYCRCLVESFEVAEAANVNPKARVFDLASRSVILNEVAPDHEWQVIADLMVELHIVFDRDPHLRRLHELLCAWRTDYRQRWRQRLPDYQPPRSDSATSYLN